MRNLNSVLTYVFFGAVALYLLASLAQRLLRSRMRKMNVQVRDRMVAIAGMENEFVEVRADEVADLNTAGLERYTEQLRTLGFQHLLDYRLRRGGKKQLEGFARLFHHPQEACFAEIMAAGALRKDKPLLVAINTFMDAGWSLGTSNIPATKADYFMRMPRVLRMRYPDESVERLYARHLERRGQILHDLGIQVLGGGTCDFYFEQVRENTNQRASAMQSVNPVGDLPLAEAQATARDQEWLGDYPAEARRIRESRSVSSPSA